MALYCYANGFDDDGRPSWKCSTCELAHQRLRGCGKLQETRGKMRLKTSGDHDLHGTCPVYWRITDWVQDIVTWSRWRENLGHPKDWPNLLFEALTWLDYFGDERVEKKRVAAKAKEKK